MKLTLENYEDVIRGWLVLKGADNWAQVEGNGLEWTKISEGIRAGEDVRFKRCALRIDGDSLVFWSPRNADSERDEVRVSKDDGPALAALIDEAVAGLKEQP